MREGKLFVQFRQNRPRILDRADAVYPQAHIRHDERRTADGAGAAGSGSPLTGVLNSKLFLAIREISGGVKFPSASQGSGAQLSAELLLDSPQDATSLLNVVNFLASIAQMNSSSVPAVGPFLALLSNLETSVTGSTLNVGLNISETSLEQLFQQVGQIAQNHAELKN